MPRAPRSAQSAPFYHVLNRGNAGCTLFTRAADYRAFVSVLAEAGSHAPMRVLAYCVLPNHWHLILWPANVTALSAYMRWITSTHARRWLEANDREYGGHVYQGRYTSVPILGELHLLTALRYVEANALRAGLVRSAVDWPWCSAAERRTPEIPLTDWPIPRPANWLDLLNQAAEPIRVEIVKGTGTRIPSKGTGTRDS